ncbi:CHAT domain-containing protein [Labedaea rhizosphaerae]|uniref:CHAT domain-containing protein n=1 Tax=Labedaea rhizosphaerae TaxID=598644 RepID=A0A4R6SFL9_LABRH|nr:CHAT domain-containing protein [Labedaea rhizosphaerae]TDQ00384.1 CHAT domain-containing protein [Labedaea rhizosphaerae]
MAGPDHELTDRAQVARDAASLREETLELESGSDEQLRLYHDATVMTVWSSMLDQDVTVLDTMLHIVLNGIRSATHAGRALFPLNDDLLVALAAAATCHIERFDYRYELSDLDEAQRHAIQVLELGAGRDIPPSAAVDAHLVLGRVAVRRSQIGIDPEAVHRIIPALRDCVETYNDALTMAVLADCLRVSVAHPDTTPEYAQSALSEAAGLFDTLLRSPRPDIPVGAQLSAQWLSGFGLVYYAAYLLGRSEDELEEARRLLGLAHDVDRNNPEVALALALVDDSTDGYRQAMHLSTRNAFVFAQASAMLAYALRGEDDEEGVGDAARSALNLVHNLAERQVLPEDRLDFLRKSADLVALAAPALAAVPGRTVSAVEHIERARMTTLRERFPHEEPELFRLGEVRPDLATPLRRALETWRSPHVSTVARAAARDKVMYYQDEARAVPGFERLRDIPDLARLRLDAPLVYLVPGHPAGAAFVLYPDREPTAHPVPGCARTPVPEPVVNFQQATYGTTWPAGARRAAVSDIAAWAWDALYAPIREAISGYSHVHVVMTSYLTGVPLHAARNNDGTYALAETDIRYVPSAGALLLARQRAFPGFEPRLLAIPQPTGSGVALDNATAEAQDVAAFFQDAQILDPDDIDRATVLGALGGVGLLHASCHGTADPDDPLASGLELDHGERFTLRELFDRPQDHLLVAVLSACQTNVPDVELPDEAISLAAGMLMSGCRAVVASAWQVPDTATAELMRETYRRWRTEGMDLPEALRAAQLGMCERAPYYWAGFSYSGP